MSTKKTKTNQHLKEVQAQFSAWRRNGKAGGRIPDSLWDAATSLSDSLSINEVSRALGLNRTALKDRVEAKGHSLQAADCQPAFIEFPPLGAPKGCAELTLEIEKADLKIKFHMKVPVDPVSFARTLMGGQRI